MKLKRAELELHFSQVLSPGSNPEMTLMVVSDGDLLRVLVGEGTDAKVAIGQLQKPLRITKLAELLGTYPQSPEASGPTITLEPEYDDGSLRSWGRGCTDWEREMLLASWAADPEGRSIYERLKEISPTTVKRIYKRTGRVLSDELSKSLGRAFNRRNPPAQKRISEPMEAVTWLLTKLSKAGGPISVRDLSYEVDDRIAGALSTVIIRAETVAPHLARQVVEEMLRLEAARQTYPTSGLHAPMGRAWFRDGLGWLQRTLLSVRRRSRTLGVIIPAHFPPIE